MKIVLANDHAGFSLKTAVKEWLEQNNYEVADLGTYSDESVDYPDFAHMLAGEVEDHNGDEIGLLMCGTGNGVAITANKHKKIRAALAWNPEIAALARQHNDANVLCLPARFISVSQALDIVKAFFDAKFEGGRHERRVEKI
jgi:ribose 5-phosphate isomerase B